MLKSGESILDDGFRILMARVVARYDQAICISLRHATHDGSLLAVAIASTSENTPESRGLGLRLQDRSQHVFQSVRRMRIVEHNDCAVLEGQCLQAAGDRRGGCQRIE